MIAELFSLILFHTTPDSKLIDLKPQSITPKFANTITNSHPNLMIDTNITALEKLTPTPTPAPVISQTYNLVELFSRYSNQYYVDKNLLMKIAQCESGLNPSARNLSYLGLYQFNENTWKNYRLKMQLNPDPSLRANPDEAIKTAAYMISVGQVGAWPSCSK